MKVTSKTKYNEEFQLYEQFLTQESIQQLKQAAEQQFTNCYNLTIDEFWGVVNGNYELLGNLEKPTVYQTYWLKRFADFVDELSNACERLSLRPTPEMEQCQNGVVKIQPMEAMLVFTRSYFGLPSFADAGKRTIGEYLTARKDDYNTKRVQRNFEELQKRKLRSKSRGK